MVRGRGWQEKEERRKEKKVDIVTADFFKLVNSFICF